LAPVGLGFPIRRVSARQSVTTRRILGNDLGTIDVNQIQTDTVRYRSPLADCPKVQPDTDRYSCIQMNRNNLKSPGALAPCGFESRPRHGLTGFHIGRIASDYAASSKGTPASTPVGAVPTARTRFQDSAGGCCFGSPENKGSAARRVLWRTAGADSHAKHARPPCAVATLAFSRAA